MKRACGICEHCKKKPATQIRHITFVRIYKELLEDLIAICDHCNSTQKNLKAHIEKPVKYAPIIIYVITSLIVLVTILLVLLKTYTHIL
jgi:protein-arginine kinase activator protein McsA